MEDKKSILIDNVKDNPNNLDVITMSIIDFDNELYTLKTIVDKEQNLMIYIIDGQLQFSNFNKIANKGDMIFFDQSSDDVQLTSISEEGSYLVLAGKPLNEPVARYGPFVANSEGEIKKAMTDYQDGKMGTLA